MVLLAVVIPWAIIKIVILVILGVYEVLVRIIPTVGDITILGNIIKFLQWLSSFLNTQKKK